MVLNDDSTCLNLESEALDWKKFLLWVPLEGSLFPVSSVLFVQWEVGLILSVLRYKEEWANWRHPKSDLLSLSLDFYFFLVNFLNFSDPFISLLILGLNGSKLWGGERRKLSKEG